MFLTVESFTVKLLEGAMRNVELEDVNEQLSVLRREMAGLLGILETLSREPARAYLAKYVEDGKATLARAPYSLCIVTTTDGYKLLAAYPSR
jgi:hypothetical protein